MNPTPALDSKLLQLFRALKTHLHLLSLAFLPFHWLYAHKEAKNFPSWKIHSGGPICCSVTKSHPTFWDPTDSTCQASLSFTVSQSLLKPVSIESVMPSNPLLFCHPLLLLPLVFLSIKVFWIHWELQSEIRLTKQRLPNISDGDSFSFSQIGLKLFRSILYPLKFIVWWPTNSTDESQINRRKETDFISVLCACCCYC